MSLTDMVIMPSADYLDACNAIREKTGSSAAIKSGELGSKIRSISSGGGAEPRLQSKTVTPSTAQQTVTPDSGYDGLGKVTVVGDGNLAPGNIKSGVSIFGVYGAFEGNGGSGEIDHSAEDGFVTRTLTSYTNSRVTSIGLYAFREMTSLLSVNFPNVTDIGTYAFWYSSNLQSCSFPNARGIGTGAFQNCRALTTLDFPVATSVGNQTFSGCSGLTALILRNESAVCSLSGTNSFTDTPVASGTGYIYVPRALVDSYKVAANWSTYANQIRAIEDYPEICG